MSKLVCFMALFVSLGVHSSELSDDMHMVGHLKPLGSHRPPDVITEELHTVPHPREFWEKFVSPRKPVVFRGAAKHSRAFHVWTEEFLISEYGNLTLRLEAKHEDSDRIPVGGQGILGRDTVEHFIANYQTMNAYVISQIPQPMEKDISIPLCLRCGSFVDSIQDVHLFLSAGGGKTIIHRDPYSNIHCVFNGTKDWILIDRSQTNLIYMSDESRNELGGYSVVDVDAVDLEKFPKIQEVKYSKITMEKGDCIFIPGGLWHQVRSRGYMNSAVSIWFSRLYKFHDKDCDAADIRFTPMDEVPILWHFSGHGTLTHGHMDIHFIRKLLLISMDVEGKLPLRSFTDYFFVSQAEDKRELLDKHIKERGKQLREYLDPDNFGFITKEQVENFSNEKMKEILLFFDPVDMANMEEFEYSHVNTDDITDALTKCLDRNGHFHKDRFIQRYTEDIGGTLAKAKEIVENLKLDDESKITLDELLKKASSALHKYHNALTHDPSFEHKMIRHLSQHEEL